MAYTLTKLTLTSVRVHNIMHNKNQQHQRKLAYKYIALVIG